MKPSTRNMGNIKKNRDLFKLHPELKKSSKKPEGKEASRKKREFCDFAQEHGFVINPAGYDYYIKSFLMFNHCPCDSNRKNCPCPESIQEVTQKGYCLCRLFWRSYEDFKNTMFFEEEKD